MYKLYRQKKAEAESQFNWIFVLIAGGIILLLFVTFIYRYKLINDQKQELLFNRQLDLQLSMSEISTLPSLTNRTDIPNKEYKFGCQGFSGVSFGKRSVFTPSSVKSNELIIYSYPFKAPFKVTNFVYIIDPNVIYVIIAPAGDEESEEVYRQITATLGIARSSVKLVRYDSYAAVDKAYVSMFKSVRFIFINADEVRQLQNDIDGRNNPFKRNKVSALKITNDLRETYTLYFYESAEDNGLIEQTRTYYFDDASLLGAVIVDKKDMYDCMMANAFERLYYLSDVYLGKLDELKANADVRQDCKDYYVLNDDGDAEKQGPGMNINSLKENVAGKLKDKEIFTMMNQDTSYRDNFYSSVTRIENNNAIAERELEGCPAIY